ncbi:hypothetical protein [uncultured Clostridium sp.]|uniref:hypothetical protein n=1 Tax=uncultured Clostridium sp. TaxID=59620 RepID=UPI0025CD95F6|nr:hypothetical protein [uncultured Clostridium sp.]
MVFKFLRWLKANVNEENFRLILNAADDDIKFNRVLFNKKTGPEKYIDICLKCADVILMRVEKLNTITISDITSINGTIGCRGEKQC